MTFEQWSVVVVPFPFADRDTQMRRPAVVLSNRPEFGVPSGHSVLAMVTSAAHTPWPLDVEISDLAAAGLSAPSVIRMKIFTRDNRLIQRQVGALGGADREETRKAVSKLLG